MSEVRGLPSDCVSFLKEEFYESAETPADQISILANTRYICAAIDIPTIKTKLIPFLDAIAKRGCVEDEVLFQVVQQLYEVSQWLGDSTEDLTLLLPSLEFLAQQEETVVRDAAVDVIGKLLKTRCEMSARASFAREHILPIYERLSTGSLPAKVTCCNLCPHIYEYLDEEKASAARLIFLELIKDEVPLVRRAAAAQLKALVDRMDSQDAVSNLLPTMMDCWNEAPADTQDQLRCSTLSAIMALTKKVTNEDREKLLIVIAHATYDPSWRIRLRVVQELPTLMAALPPEIVEDVACGWLESAIRDSESEVQVAAVEALKLSIPYMQGPELEKRLLPIFIALSEPEMKSQSDEFSSLEGFQSQCHFTFAAGLAGLLGPIAKKLGKHATERQLVPLLSKFIEHSLREVRNNATEQLGDICEVLGAATALQILFPVIKAAISDQQWRIRLALVEQIPRMARLFGSESFLKTEWEGLYFGALLDHAHAVRQAAVNSVVDIGNHFGPEWARTYLLDNLLGLYDRAFHTSKGSRSQDLPAYVKTLHTSSRPIESYTSRNTLLHALGKIALVITEQDVTDKILPRLLKTLGDPIPNVRFTTLSVLTELVQAGKLPVASVDKTLIPRMGSMTYDDDADVQFFAGQAISACQKWLEVGVSKGETTATSSPPHPGG